jgi:lipopolysaccharide transport system permease protein
MTGVIEGFRWALLGTSQPPDWTLAVSALLTVPLFIGGLYMFKRSERNIVDIV